jgi:hypothetical protein
MRELVRQHVDYDPSRCCLSLFCIVGGTGPLMPEGYSLGCFVDFLLPGEDGIAVSAPGRCNGLSTYFEK